MPTLARGTALLIVLLACRTLGVQDAHQTFRVGTASATRGAAAVGTLVVPPAVDSGLRIPVAVSHGARPGPIVAFVAGDIRSPSDGVVTFIRGVPSMWPRATLVNVAPVVATPPAWVAP